MRLSTALGTLGTVLLALALASIELQAQTCGGTCLDCGIARYEGYITVGNNPTWEQTCDFNPILDSCTFCKGPDGVASDFVPAMNIGSALEVLEREELPDFLAAYGPRVRINPERPQVIVMGTECEEAARGAIVNVSANTWKELRDLGAQVWSARFTVAGG